MLSNKTGGNLSQVVIAQTLAGHQTSSRKWQVTAFTPFIFPSFPLLIELSSSQPTDFSQMCSYGSLPHPADHGLLRDSHHTCSAKLLLYTS